MDRIELPLSSGKCGTADAMLRVVLAEYATGSSNKP